MLKHERVSKYYASHSLKHFLLNFMFLLTAKFLQKSHIEAITHFIFLKTF